MIRRLGTVGLCVLLLCCVIASGGMIRKMWRYGLGIEGNHKEFILLEDRVARLERNFKYFIPDQFNNECSWCHYARRSHGKRG